MTNDRPLRRVLIISPAFPPINAPDMQRIRMSLPYYRDHGWEPIVLTVNPAAQDSSREEALLATVPGNVKIHRCSAFPLWCTRRFGLTNLGLRSWLFLFFAGRRIILREKIDLVFFSNTQFVTFPLGRIWRFLLGVPYVIDLQDPWRTDYYERTDSRQPPGGWKYQFARLQAWLLEGWSFRRMSGFMSVSQHYLDDLKKRYRWFAKIPAAVIRFGTSETDLNAARQLPPTPNHPPAEPGILNFIYTGAAGPIMPHSLGVLFGGLKKFREIDPTGAYRLRFAFLGTSYAALGEGKATVLPIAAEFEVADQVIEVPHRLGHLECLQIQASADVLLMLGSSDLAYSPSKLYPYYLSGRPMLAVVFKRSYLEALLRDLTCSTLVSFEDGAPLDQAHDQLCAFFANALADFPEGTLPVRNEAFFQAEYLARTLTARQCALFNTTQPPPELLP